VTSSEVSKPRQSAGRTALAGVIGNILEWFDFGVYGFFVGTIGKVFFPGSDPVAQTLLAFIGFGAGFLGRPIGSLLLGVIGDRIGRRALLTLSIALMGGATLLIGVLPTYASLGIAAPIALVTLRFIQGIAVGGEFTGSMVYTTELASPLWRGLVSSSTAAGTTIGLMVANTTNLIIRGNLNDAQLQSWGWRIPFIASFLLVLAGWLLRRGIMETEEGLKAAAEQPLAGRGKGIAGFLAALGEAIRALGRDWLPIVRTFGIVAMTNAAYYLTFTFAAERRTSLGKAGSNVFWAANLISLAVVLLAKPFGGWLSDQVGRRRLMMILTVLGMIAIYIALPMLLEGDPWHFWLAQIILAVPFGMALGLHGAILVEIFPLRSRVTSMSFAYSVTLALSGGLLPLVSTWLLDVLHAPTAPTFYIMAYGVVGLVIMWPMKETNARRLDQ
jgi:MFS family permease